MSQSEQLYEVWVHEVQGWRLDRRTTFRDTKMCKDAYEDEVHITPAPVMTAEAWVAQDEM